MPQGFQEAETTLRAFLKREEEKVKKAEEKKMLRINDKIHTHIPVSSAEMADWRRWAGLQPSSSSVGIKRKKRRRTRRKKQLPKGSSSLFLRGSCGGAGDQGIMHEYAVGETEDVIEYVQRADGPKNIHTVVAFNLHAEPLEFGPQQRGLRDIWVQERLLLA